MKIRRFFVLSVVGYLARRYWVRRPQVSLANKVVLVTGASSGIGLATAFAFAREDCHVVLIARREQLLMDIKGEIDRQYKHPALVIAADLSKDADLERIIKETMKIYARIDVLINNAGISPTGQFDKYSLEDIRQTIDINLYAPLRLTHLVIPIMKAQKSGHIVNISSSADIGRPIGHGAYVASKSGLSAFSEAMSRELRYDGIHITDILPGWTYTPLLTHESEAIILQKLKDADLFSMGMVLDTAETVANKIVESIQRKYYRVVMGGWIFHLMEIGRRISPRLLDFGLAMFTRNPEKTMQFLYDETHKSSQE